MRRNIFDESKRQYVRSGMPVNLGNWRERPIKYNQDRNEYSFYYSNRDYDYTPYSQVTVQALFHLQKGDVIEAFIWHSNESEEFIFQNNLQNGNLSCLRPGTRTGRIHINKLNVASINGRFLYQTSPILQELYEALK